MDAFSFQAVEHFCGGLPDICGGLPDFCGGPGESCGGPGACNSLENSTKTRPPKLHSHVLYKLFRCGKCGRCGQLHVKTRTYVKKTLYDDVGTRRPTEAGQQKRKIMKKQLFIAAAALLALAGCSSDEFVGDNTSPTTSDANGAIQFTSDAGKITRADRATSASNLGYSFHVYATKAAEGSTNADDDDVFSNVFALNPYSSPASGSHSPYWVWYTASTANQTTSNTSNWDYVGKAATGDPASPTYGTDGHKVTLTSDQTIKYWDYSAKKYEFVAYKETEGSPTISNYTKDGFTVTATAAQLAGLYVADKVTLLNADANLSPSKPANNSATVNKIGDVVKFTFRAAASKVRLGIYETIPGYDVRNIKFYYTNSTEQSSTTNAYLTGSFNGTSSGAEGTYNVTYNASGLAIFDASAAASTYFDFGSFASATPENVGTAIGTLSTSPMWATGSSTYQSVLPNTDNVANMILKVDYELYNATSGETIKVNGATAVVPQMYMTWNPNYAYTYLFKISDNTNGKTKPGDGNPVGLYPITFDAVTVATTDGAEVGTITTVSTPAITTYQEGSVVDIETTEPVVSKHGITYANANGPIYITVNTDGTLASLTAENTKLYTVAEGTTETDLILTTKTKTSSALLSILAADEEKQGITFTSGKAAKFTPAASTTYAIEYKVSDAVTAVYSPATGTYVSGTKYFTDNTGATEVDTSAFVAGTTDVSSYYVLTTPAAPAVYQYKIIVVGAGS